MKILVISQHYFPESFSITSICEYWAKIGFGVTVLTAQPSYGKTQIYKGYEKVFREERNGVQIIRVRTPARGKSAFSLLKNYFFFLVNSFQKTRHLGGDFDCVFSACLSPITSVLSACSFSKKHHIPHIHYCLDVWPESAVETGYVKYGGFLYKKILSLSKFIYKRCDNIIISSNCFSDYLRQVNLVPSSKIIYIPQPVFDPRTHTDSLSLKGMYSFVFAGNIGTIQMVDLFISAIDLLPDNLSCCLYIVGSGSKLSDAQSLADSIKHKERVIFTGRVSPIEAARYCEAATALLIALKPSDSTVSHTLPNKLITYFGFGKPIISCLRGDGQKALDEANGYISAEANAESFARAFQRLCTLKAETVNAMGENNRKYFLSHFIAEKSLSDLAHVIQSAKCQK